MFDETVYESAEETVNHGANMVSESAEAAGGDAAEGDGGAGLAEGDGGAGLTDEDESDPTVPFEHGDPVGNFHLHMYAVPPPPPGYKAPPIALMMVLDGAGKGGKAAPVMLDGAGKGGKAAPVMLDGAGRGGKEAPVMLDGASKGGKAAPKQRYFIHKGAKAPSVALDGVSTGSSSSASERSLASTREKAPESNQKGKGCKGKDVERLPQWVLLKDGMLPAHPDHESDAESLDPIEEEEGEEQLSVPVSQDEPGAV